MASATDPNGTAGEIMVVFGGRGADGALQNLTWVYQYSPLFGPARWINETNAASAPPALYHASMDFDPHRDSFVLFGGELANGAASNQTWLLDPNSFDWTNYSRIACSLVCPAARSAASMAFGPTGIASYSLLFGGCNTGCTSAFNDTWILYPYNSDYYLWLQVKSTSAPSPRYAASLALVDFFGNLSLMVFGGLSTNSTIPLNDTWYFASYGWNLLPWQAYGAPPGRGFAEMTFDWGSLGTIITGGNSSTTPIYKDSWEFECSGGSLCGWIEVTGTIGEVSVSAGAISSLTFSSEPIIFGGVDGGTGVTSDTTWILQATVTLALAVTTTTPERNQPNQFIASAFGGPFDAPFHDRAWPKWEFRGPNGTQFELTGNRTIDFVVQGVWNVTGVVVDNFDIRQSGSWTLTVTVPIVRASASSYSTDVGVQITFHAAFEENLVAGVTTFLWNFGDGTNDSIGQPTHIYSVPGTFTVLLTAADPLNNSAYQNLTIIVHALPTLKLSTPSLTVDASTRVIFDAALAGGTGPFRLEWGFGDGGTQSNGWEANHSFSAAGIYLVVIHGSDEAGAVFSSNLTITALTSVRAEIVPDSGSIAAQVPATFTAIATGGSGNYSFHWLVGANSQESGSVLTFTFALPGDYGISLWVNDSLGGSSRVISTEYVGQSSSEQPSLSPLGYLLVYAPLVVSGMVGLMVLVVLVVNRRARAAISDDRRDIEASANLPPEDGEVEELYGTKHQVEGPVDPDDPFKV